MSTVGNAIKIFPAILLKSFTILLFCIFGLWLLQMVYFPGLEVKKSAVAALPSEEKDPFGHIFYLSPSSNFRRSLANLCILNGFLTYSLMPIFWAFNSSIGPL